MGSGFAEALGVEESPSDQAMEHTLAGTAHALIDGLSDEGLFDLVGDLPAPLLLGDQPGAHERPQDLPDGLQRLYTQLDQLTQLGRAAESGKQFEDLEGGPVELL